jgi:hypothetical protein
LDTRTKIVDGAHAEAVVERLLAERPGVKLVRGAFDPLLAAHVKALREAAGGSGRVIVVLRDPEQALLSPRARAELVAGLGIVAAVVLPEQGDSRRLRGLPMTDLNDGPWRARLMALIRERHREQ